MKKQIQLQNFQFEKKPKNWRGNSNPQLIFGWNWRTKNTSAAGGHFNRISML